MAMYRDNFVNVGDGKEHNYPILIPFEVVNEWHIPALPGKPCGFWYRDMTDGIRYERPDTYYEHSPYGWNIAKIQAPTIQEKE